MAFTSGSCAVPAWILNTSGCWQSLLVNTARLMVAAPGHLRSWRDGANFPDSVGPSLPASFAHSQLLGHISAHVVLPLRPLSRIPYPAFLPRNSPLAKIPNCQLPLPWTGIVSCTLWPGYLQGNGNEKGKRLSGCTFSGESEDTTHGERSRPQGPSQGRNGKSTG